MELGILARAIMPYFVVANGLHTGTNKKGKPGNGKAAQAVFCIGIAKGLGQLRLIRHGHRGTVDEKHGPATVEIVMPHETNQTLLAPLK